MILFTTINAGGNITSAKTYPYTTGSISGSPLSQKTYSYSSSGWKDLLTNFNGDSIIYDEIGNPTQYRDGMNIVWENGRRLASITQGTNSYSYSYDSSGVRISKTVNGTTYSYIYDNGQLIYADTPSGGMTFFYENDSIVGYKYGPEYYYYIKNLQGDIIGVIDKNCNLLYQYEYDAWGNHTVLDAQNNVISPDASHIANANPLRYRGYFFDAETGLYYLLSRYYDPTTGRFVNIDEYISTGQGLLGFNMFAYCLNNPINRSDALGGISCACNPWRPMKGCLNHGFFKNNQSFSEGMYVNVYLKIMPSIVAGAYGASPRIGSSTQSPYLNSDGSYSLYDNRRHNPNSVFHEQILSVDTSGPSWDISNGSIGIGSIEGSLITGGWEWEHANLSILDVGTVKAAAEINSNGVQIGAMASAYTPSFSFDIFGVQISISGHVGSVGLYGEFGKSGFSFGGAAGCGFSLSVGW